VVDRVALRWSFVQALLFSLPIIISAMFPTRLLSEAGTVGPFEAYQGTELHPNAVANLQPTSLAYIKYLTYGIELESLCIPDVIFQIKIKKCLGLITCPCFSPLINRK
jgi:hypothetical protein